jgi:hypothetical protein
MTRATPLPKWKDEAGVAALVEEHLTAHRMVCESYAEFAIEVQNDPPRPHGDPDDDVIWFAGKENAAVEAAKRGDLVALIELLRGPHLDWLQPETVELVIEFMTGKRNPQTGRRRGEGKVGASEMTPEEKAAKNPLRSAAAEFDLIRGLLRKLYPAESRRAIRKHAFELAAERASVKPERLDNYLNRARGVRREGEQPFFAKHHLRKTDL